MNEATIRKAIAKKFKIKGYTLKRDAFPEIISFVNEFIGAQNHDALDEALQLLIDDLKHSKSAIIGKEQVQRVTSLLIEADAQLEDSSGGARVSTFEVIDAFYPHKFRFDPIRKHFYECTGPYPPRHGDASAKVGLYKDRFLLLSQRISRDPHFSKPVFGSEMSHFGSCEISSIQSLVGPTRRRWIMGVISQLEDGHFYLEDLTSIVKIDLSKAKITTGLFSENTIVVAEGEMLAVSATESVFQVMTCGFPPLEDREKSVKLFAGHDYFGSGVLTREENLRLAEMERRAVNDMFVILSDIWLDDEEAMRKLEIVLDGYESVEVVPSLFVFMGNFCSRPCNLSFNSYSTLRSQFGKLGQLIEAHPRLKENSKFLFIPGPDDAGPATVLPRPALPKYLTEELKQLIPDAIFASNPCRIKYYTQEIVLLRQDLLYRMRRSCLVPPSTAETSDPFEHLVATMIHQSHLCPLPLTVQPIIWDYDHSLHLYPTPHTIVLGDKSEQKAFKYIGTTCFNPGSFSSDSTFVAYRPCTQEVELSAL